MEKYEKKDPEIFNKCITNCKFINKMKKIEIERKLLEEKEVEKKIKIFQKHQKLILQNKYKYNFVTHKKIKGFSSDFKKQKNK